MTARTGTAVIVVAHKTLKTGEERTTYYGPFLPHVGSATTWFLRRVENELDESGLYENFVLTIENLFIGDDESDCAVMPKGPSTTATWPRTASTPI